MVALALRHTLFTCLLVMLSAGCKAQSAPSTPANSVAPTPAPQLTRKIEVLVRSQFDVPANVEVTVGNTSKSEFPGFNNLPITFASNGKQSVVNFLLSSDGNTVARLERFDLSKTPTDVITTQGRPVRGPADAKVTIVNFDDLECPYCARMHEELFPATQDRYKGLVKFVYKDFPLVEIHPWALHAAVAAGCLAEQNGPAYWEFVDYIHSHADEVKGSGHDVQESYKTLDKLARAQGQGSHLDMSKLDACLVKQDETAVRASMKQGDGLNINGTPTLFINGERISGALPQAELWMTIDRALKEAGVQSPPQVAETGKKPGAPAEPRK